MALKFEKNSRLFELEEKKVSLEEMLEYVSTIDEGDDFDEYEEDNTPDIITEDELNEMDELNEDELFEDEASHENTMTDEELKVESLKIATNIAKLMSDVTTDDIISIADKVSGFIRDHEIGSDNSESDNKEDKESDEEEIDLGDFGSMEDNEEENEETSEEK